MKKAIGCLSGCAGICVLGFIGLVLMIVIGPGSSTPAASENQTKQSVKSEASKPAIVEKPTLEAVINKRFKSNLRAMEIDSKSTLRIDATMEGNLTLKMQRGSMSTQARELMSEVFSDPNYSKQMSLVVIRYYAKVQDARGRETDAIVAVYSLPSRVGKTVVWDNIYSEALFLNLLKTQEGTAEFMLKELQFTE